MQWSCIPHSLLHQIYNNVCSLFLNILNIMHLLAASDSDIYSISSSAGRFPGKDDRQAHSNRSAAVSHQSSEVLKPCCQWMHFTKPTFFMWCKHEEEWEGREHPFIQGGEVKKKMRQEYQGQGINQKADKFMWNEEKWDTNIGKIPAMRWSDWTYNLIMVPSWANSDLLNTVTQI